MENSGTWHLRCALLHGELFKDRESISFFFCIQRTGYRPDTKSQIVYCTNKHPNYGVTSASPLAELVKNQPASAGGAGDSASILGQEGSLEEETATHSRLLPGKSYGQRSLVDCNPWGRKEADTTEYARTHTHTRCNY